MLGGMSPSLLILLFLRGYKMSTKKALGNASLLETAKVESTQQVDNAEDTQVDNVKHPVESKSLKDKSELDSGTKIRIVHDTYKDNNIYLFNGEKVYFNKEGVAEVEDEKIADYLLSIPLYKRK